MATESAVKASVCEFTSKVYQTLIEPQKDSPVNTFISPLSVYATMAMTLSGSDGNTKNEMLKALQMPEHFGSSEAHQSIGSTLKNYFKSTKGVTLSLANGMFACAGENFNQQFALDLRNNYQACSENLPFNTNPEASRIQINNWVAQETKNKIRELLAPGSIRDDTYMVLANALYFRGSWARKFNKENTTAHDFHKLGGSTIKVNLMFTREDMDYAELPDMDASLVRLAFLESNWEMVIVVPNKRDGLKDLMKKMCEPNTLSTVLSTECYNTKVELFLPRFKLGEGDAVDMVKPLTKMGMNDVFVPGRANLSRIANSHNLYVSTVQHKAILEVDEEGATAAAATAGGIALMCAPCYPEVRADHPFFVALVCDKTIPVFLGHVTEPETF